MIPKHPTSAIQRSQEGSLLAFIACFSIFTNKRQYSPMSMVQVNQNTTRLLELQLMMSTIFNVAIPQYHGFNYFNKINWPCH